MTTLRRSLPTPTLFLAILLALLWVVPSAHAASDAVATMARIVSDMHHYPSDSQKETLADISQNQNLSEATRTLADVIQHIEHQPSEEGIARLESVLADPEATEAEKTLADVVMRFKHKAGPGSQEMLDKLK
ncbi:hypothetical protein QQM79_20040 [Marinobacteraceae bacterium S3BR75-40.1]